MTATASPVRNDHRYSGSLNGARRARWWVFGGLLLVTAALLAVSPASSVAGTDQAACNAAPPPPKAAKVLCLTVSDSPDPVAYSTFDGNSTWLTYQAVVTNESKKGKLPRVQLKEKLPATTTFVSATPSAGKCSNGGQRVACKLGTLKRGKAVTVDVVVRAPTSMEADPPDATLTNKVAASFKKRASQGAKAKAARQRVRDTETTTVSKDAGQTYVPMGQTGKVGTDPSEAQYANSTIPDASTGVLAFLEVAPPDDFCQNGKVKIGYHDYVCRAGGFVEASVRDAETGETYSNEASPMVFHLQWDAPLVSSKQTVKNFVVFYQPTEDSPIEVFCARCNETASNQPCLRNITRLEDGGFSVDLVKSENGRMR